MTRSQPCAVPLRELSTQSILAKANVLRYLSLTNTHIQGHSVRLTQQNQDLEKVADHRVAAAAPESLRLCPTLCDPIDGSPPGSSVPGILQARILEWVAISFSNACMHAKSLQSRLTV